MGGQVQHRVGQLVCVMPSSRAALTFLAHAALMQDHVLPHQELLQILDRHAHDRQKDRRREYPRDSFDEVTPAFIDQQVDEGGGQRLLRVAQALHATGREVLRQHLSPLGVIRWIDHDRNPLVRRLRFGRHDDTAGPELRMLQAVQEHRIVGEHPVVHPGFGITEYRPRTVLTFIQPAKVCQRGRVGRVHLDAQDGTC